MAIGFAGVRQTEGFQVTATRIDLQNFGPPRRSRVDSPTEAVTPRPEATDAPVTKLGGSQQIERSKNGDHRPLQRSSSLSCGCAPHGEGQRDKDEEETMLKKSRARQRKANAVRTKTTSCAQEQGAEDTAQGWSALFASSDQASQASDPSPNGASAYLPSIVPKTGS